MKLQLKRSNVLDGGKAKEPTPPYVEYGELCVNYNTSDPALFIKDSNDTIIRIAGRGAVGEGGNPSGPSLPDTGNSIGDVFFNTGDLTLYYWDGTQWVPIANQTNAADIFVGTFAEVDVEIPEAKRQNGLLLWETEEGNLFLWYIDADTSQWVVAVPGGSGGGGGGGGGGASVTVLNVAPNNPEQGDLWYCTDDGRLYIYYQDVNTSQWVDASPDNLSEGFWERDGGVLKPLVSGDDVDLGTGDLSAADATFSGDVTSNVFYRTQPSGDPLGNILVSQLDGQDRLRIRADGGIAMGTTNIGNTAGINYLVTPDGTTKIGGSVATSPNIELRASGGASFNEEFYSYRPGTGTAAIMQWSSDQGGTKSQVAKISRNGQFAALSTTIASITSERRLKENIEFIDPEDSWETIKSVPYYSYNFKGGDVTCFGPMADEVPQEMVEETDMSDKIGPIRTFNNGMLQARLYVALQTALTRIEALEAEVQQLKGGN